MIQHDMGAYATFVVFVLVGDIVHGPQIKYNAYFVKQQPGRARQNNKARAERNFWQPCISGPCVACLCGAVLEKMMPKKHMYKY